MARKRLLLGELETAVLDVLWTLGPSTVADVLGALPEPPVRHYNTCSTVLTRLAKRGIVVREDDPDGGRAHVYRAAVSRDEMGRAYLDVVRNDLFGGSLDRVVASLLAGKAPDPDRRRRLAALLDDWPDAGDPAQDDDDA